MYKCISKILLLLFAIGVMSCSSIMTNTEFYKPIVGDLKNDEFAGASQQVLNAELTGEYSEKDRVLLHLDKGMLFHYQGEYQRSNEEFEKAELAIEDLYTKSISKGVASILLNDNALAYSGEVYEDLYLNVFKALNYLHLNQFDNAYVEIKRVNDKLKLLDTRYEQYVSSLNSSKDSKIKIDPKDLDYYNNVLSHYISHIIFREEGEEDNSRISLEKLEDAWSTYPDVYNYDRPSFLSDPLKTAAKGTFINFMAFTGQAPYKNAVGARVTTFDDFVTISDPGGYWLDAIPFPGIKYGWNFKFSFPELAEEGTEVYDIEVYIDSVYSGNLELLENMANVARKTFETNKSIIFLKTVTRAVLKGVGASALGREIKKGKNEFLGDILVALTNAAVDATENADLRCWRTMPSYCFASEIPLRPGTYNIELRYVDRDNNIIKSHFFDGFRVTKGINVIESFHLN